MAIALISDLATKLLLWGIVVHLFCDWILQNDYLASNKVGWVQIRLWRYAADSSSRRHITIPHRAAWIHAGIHCIGLLLVFPWHAALIIAAIHLLIDTRIPLRWWQGVYRQTQKGDVALHVAMWSDQVLHITVLAIAALIVGGIWSK